MTQIFANYNFYAITTLQIPDQANV